MSLTGLSYTTLTDSVWVAREFANARRRALLEWWPHRETAPLDPPDQDVVLDQVGSVLADLTPCGSSETGCFMGNINRFRLGCSRVRRHAPARVARVVATPRDGAAEGRAADGRPKREIIRCLKRILARETYQWVMTDCRARQHLQAA